MRAIVLGRTLGETPPAPPPAVADLIRQIESDMNALPGFPARTSEFDPSRFERIADDFQRTRFRLQEFAAALPELERTIDLADSAAVDARIRLVSYLADRLLMAASTTADDLAPELWSPGDRSPGNQSTGAKWYRFGMMLRDTARTFGNSLNAAAATIRAARPAAPQFRMPQGWNIPTADDGNGAAIAIVAIVALAARRRRR